MGFCCGQFGISLQQGLSLSIFMTGILTIRILCSIIFGCSADPGSFEKEESGYEENGSSETERFAVGFVFFHVEIVLEGIQQRTKEWRRRDIAKQVDNQDGEAVCQSAVIRRHAPQNCCLHWSLHSALNLLASNRQQTCKEKSNSRTTA